MRLIKASSLALATPNPPFFKEIFDSSDKNHRYIILSHRWGDDELTYQQVSDPIFFWDNYIFNKRGYKKLQRFAQKVHNDYREYGIEWIWCDTCCIDKKDTAELSEAINSMYRWYRDSKACFAYLADWPSAEVMSITESVWFTRCWTLQELIAPAKVMFFDCEWKPRGNKFEFANEISRSTGIDPMLLRGEKLIDKFSVAQRMSWTRGRTALKREDETYCLLGIFGVSMPMLYGEGENAFLRLQEQIIQRNADQSIFVWSSTQPSKNLLASSAADFASSNDIHQTPKLRRPFSLNNLGLEIELELRPISSNTYAAYLACEYIEPANAVTLILEYEPGTQSFYRVQANFSQPPEKSNRELRKTRKVTILRDVPSTISTTRPISTLYGFRLGGSCRSLLLINNYDQYNYWDHGSWHPTSTSQSQSQSQSQIQTQTSSSNPIFEIPQGEAPSIATMLLFIGRTRLLIHLTYDFDFRPVCHVSKHTHSLGYTFCLRSTGDFTSEEKMAWLDSTIGWTKESTHTWMDKDHPYTGEPGWAVKSLHRGGFTARIPKEFTRPYRDVEVSFSPQWETGDWMFDVRHQQVGVGDGSTFFDLGWPIVRGDSDLQEVRMRLGELGFGDLGFDELGS